MNAGGGLTALVAFIMNMFAGYPELLIYIFFLFLIGGKFVHRLVTAYDWFLVEMSLFPICVYPFVMMFSTRELSWHLLAVPRLIYISSFIALIATTSSLGSLYYGKERSDAEGLRGKA